MGLITLLIGSLAGAGLMFLMDPQQGKRRRALLRDQFVKLQNTASEQIEARTEMTADRVRGVVAETKKRISPEEVSDETLVAQVRSEMGRYVSHPGSVEVTASNGTVTLTGDVLASELEPFVAKVKSMPSVREVDNRLQAHEAAASKPNLQGGKTRPEQR